MHHCNMNVDLVRIREGLPQQRSPPAHNSPAVPAVPSLWLSLQLWSLGIWLKNTESCSVFSTIEAGNCSAFTSAIQAKEGCKTVQAKEGCRTVQAKEGCKTVHLMLKQNLWKWELNATDGEKKASIQCVHTCIAKKSVPIYTSSGSDQKPLFWEQHVFTFIDF